VISRGHVFSGTGTFHRDLFYHGDGRALRNRSGCSADTRFLRKPLRHWLSERFSHEERSDWLTVDSATENRRPRDRQSRGIIEFGNGHLRNSIPASPAARGLDEKKPNGFGTGRRFPI